MRIKYEMPDITRNQAEEKRKRNGRLNRLFHEARKRKIQSGNANNVVDGELYIYLVVRIEPLWMMRVQLRVQGTISHKRPSLYEIIEYPFFCQRPTLDASIE